MTNFSWMLFRNKLLSLSNANNGITLSQCFSTFFCLAAPLVSYIKSWRYQIDLKIDKVKTGGTPDTFSSHSSVPRHPSWEPLILVKKGDKRTLPKIKNKSSSRMNNSKHNFSCLAITSNRINFTRVLGQS